MTRAVAEAPATFLLHPVGPLLLASPKIFSSLVRSERLQSAANVVGVSGADKNGHPERLISVKPNLDFVFSGRQIESLKSSVEVIDDTGVRLVHINLTHIAGAFGVYFDPNGSVVGVPIRPIAIGTVAAITVTTITVTTITMTEIAMTVVAMTVAMPVVVLGIGLGRK